MFKTVCKSEYTMYAVTNKEFGRKIVNNVGIRLFTMPDIN